MASSSTHPLSCTCKDCYDKQFAREQMNLIMLGEMNAMTYCHHYMNHCLKNPMHDSQLSGHKWVWELWHGHEERFFQNTRMRKMVLRRLMKTCVNEGFLNKHPKHVPLEESMAIFLLILGQGFTYTAISERMQRSTETVSNHFHYVLKAICRLGNKIIAPVDPNFQHPDARLMANRRAYPTFKDCIGTHITMHIPDDEKTPWINRKGVTTTNVLAICDFNMSIIFASVGCEGSMHDVRVLRNSMPSPKRKFPFPPQGKYFLVDAGYPLMDEFLTPYKQTRYHLLEFQASRQFRNADEVFNYRHSSLRSIIERTFGVLKKRWRVLNTMSMVDIPTQIKIIWSCIALHNFIRRFDDDDIDLLGEIPSDVSNLSSRIRPRTHAEWMELNASGGNSMATIRDSIREVLISDCHFDA